MSRKWYSSERMTDIEIQRIREQKAKMYREKPVTQKQLEYIEDLKNKCKELGADLPLECSKPLNTTIQASTCIKALHIAISRKEGKK